MVWLTLDLMELAFDVVELEEGVLLAGKGVVVVAAVGKALF